MFQIHLKYFETTRRNLIQQVPIVWHEIELLISFKFKQIKPCKLLKASFSISFKLLPIRLSWLIN